MPPCSHYVSHHYQKPTGLFEWLEVYSNAAEFTKIRPISNHFALALPIYNTIVIDYDEGFIIKLFALTNISFNNDEEVLHYMTSPRLKDVPLSASFVIIANG